MSKLHIRNFDSTDLPFYTNCLLNQQWRLLYGEAEEPDDLSEFINRKTQGYPYVRRYIILKYGTNEKIGFALVDFMEGGFQECIFAGGVKPDLIGKGYGVKCSIIFCQYIFQHFTSVNTIYSDYQNIFSQKILLRIGFIEDESMNRLFDLQNRLVLCKKSFPNSFCRKFLTGDT